MKHALTLYFALTLALCAQNRDDEPTTREDLVAIGQVDRGELDGDKRPVEYTREQVEAFLNQFVGVWEGDYIIRAMQGSSPVTMTAHAQYYWELVDDLRVLKCQNVYAMGDRLTHGTSLTYYYKGRLFSEVEQDNVRRIFRGTISPDGKSVQWSAAITNRPLDTATQETVTVNDAGQPVIEISGYEEVRQGDQNAYLQLSGTLVKGKLD